MADNIDDSFWTDNGVSSQSDLNDDSITPASWETKRKLGGALTTFLVLEIITAGSGTFNFISQTIQVIFDFSMLRGIAFIFGIVSAIVSFKSAHGILKYRKSGITFGWISVAISWFSLIVGGIFALYIYSTWGTSDSPISLPDDFDASDFKGFILFLAIAAIFWWFAWALAKTISLSSRSARNTVDKHFK